MAEDFAIQGIESNSTQQKGSSVNEALFMDAYDGSKCIGGGPGAKCGAPRELPSVVLSTTPQPAEQESMRGTPNNYPGVYFDLPLSTKENYRAHKHAHKEGIVVKLQKEDKPQKEDPIFEEKPASKDRSEKKK